MNVKVVPVVLGALRAVSRKLQKWFQQISGENIKDLCAKELAQSLHIPLHLVEDSRLWMSNVRWERVFIILILILFIILFVILNKKYQKYQKLVKKTLENKAIYREKKRHYFIQNLGNFWIKNLEFLYEIISYFYKFKYKYKFL